ncbi:hypothetical protein MRX96_021004 [Rhipicephalus microplus]
MELESRSPTTMDFSSREPAVFGFGTEEHVAAASENFQGTVLRLHALPLLGPLRRRHQKVLRNTEEICIVQNNDKVYTLIQMFPNAKAIALCHDLCEHFLELEKPVRDPSTPLVKRSQLRKLVGNLKSDPESCLMLSYVTTPAVLRTCPHAPLASVEALAKISDFHNLRSLNTFWPEGDREDISLVLKNVLETFPELEELGLAWCDGVVPTTIAKLCPKVKLIQLEDCAVSAGDLKLNVRSFPHLRCLEISGKMSVKTSRLFLTLTRETLRVARFNSVSMCFEFLHYCVQYGAVLPFSRLEHLTLYTSQTLHELQLEPGKLHSVLKALPVLRHLECNSYDLRVFFENYCVPRGRLCLPCTGCLVCGVRNPKLASILEPLPPSATFQ